MKYIEGYPSRPLYFKINSRTLPEKMISNFKKKVEEQLKGLSSEGKYQSRCVYDFFNNILKNNNLLPAMPEIREAKKLLRENEVMQANEKKGIVKFCLKEKALKFDFVMTIPREYPLDTPKFSLQTTNLEETMCEIVEYHIKELIRRYNNGIPGFGQKLKDVQKFKIKRGHVPG